MSEPSAGGSPGTTDSNFISNPRIGLDLFLVSVAGLFIELVLIRWIGTEIRIFAYLQNTVLVVCFLGLGAGCLTSDRAINIRDCLKALAILLLFMTVPVTRKAFLDISSLLSSFGDFLIWDPSHARSRLQSFSFLLIGLALTFLLMTLIVEVFVPIGRLMGRLMQQHPHIITAYSLNVGGSLVGIWLFAGLSMLYLPPPFWFVFCAALLAYLVFRARTGLAGNIALLAAIAVLGMFSDQQPGASEVTWSPYQKLVLRPSNQEGDLGQWTIDVNNNHYQEMLDLSPATVAGNPETYPPELKGLSQYDLPFLVHPAPDDVLIVGAGSGNDAAGAIRAGARRVVALDIDPVIIDMGRKHHPEKPYEHPSVEIVVDDARSYFARSQEKFDLIVFGLLDSHSTTSMSNTRLDHYVYTVQSLEQARALLKPGGIIFLSFFAVQDFIGVRIGRTIEKVFGQTPIVLDIQMTNYGRGGYIFIAGDIESAKARLESNASFMQQANRFEWMEKELLNKLPGLKVAEDDWPYIYLETASIPVLYFLLGALMLALIAYCHARFGIAREITSFSRSQWHFFFMGAAFLLLEVQNISKASVVLGSTWWVNAIIISAILLMILLSNLVAARFPRINSTLVFGALLATCIGLYFVDLAVFAGLSYPVRAAVVAVLTTLPMFFSGIIFIRSFAAVRLKNAALGANLFGAIVGGLAQSLTFATGVRFLLLAVAMLYTAALLTRPGEADV